MSLDTASTGGGAYVSLIGRRVSNNNDYRLKLRYLAGGSVAAYLVNTVGGTETILASTTISGLTVAPGDVLQARFSLSGSPTTTFRAKVWRKGATEPTAWLLTNTERDAAGPAGAGWPGLPALRLRIVDGRTAGAHCRQPERHRTGALRATVLNVVRGALRCSPNLFQVGASTARGGT